MRGPTGYVNAHTFRTVLLLSDAKGKQSQFMVAHVVPAQAPAAPTSALLSRNDLSFPHKLEPHVWTGAPPITPGVVAAFGAVCQRSPGSLDLQVNMKNAEQRGFLQNKKLENGLLSFCKLAAKTRSTQVQDRVKMLPTDLYWASDDNHSALTVLGIKRNGSIFNLLGSGFEAMSEHGSNLQRVHPFGTSVVNDRGCIFFNETTGDFCRGHVDRVNTHKRTVSVSALGKMHRNVPNALVALDIEMSSTDRNSVKSTHGQLPPAAQLLLRELDALITSCAADSGTSEALRDARGLVLQITNSEQHGPESALHAFVAELANAAHGLIEASKYAAAGSDTSRCTWGAGKHAPVVRLRRAATELQLLSCRLRLAVDSHQPEILSSDSAEALYVHLLKASSSHPASETLHELIDSCKVLLVQTQPHLVAQFQAHGLGGDATLVQKAAAVQKECSGRGDTSLMTRLVEYARAGEDNQQHWQTALKQAESHQGNGPSLTRECQHAAQAYIRLLEQRKCAQTYKEAVATLGDIGSLHHHSSNAALAQSLLIRAKADGKIPDLLQRAELAKCLKNDEPTLYEDAAKEARLAGHEIHDEKVQNTIDERRKQTHAAIIVEQVSLRDKCEDGTADGAGHRALAVELSANAFLAPLLSVGNLQIDTVMSAVAEADEMLRRSPDNELLAQAQQRTSCLAQLQKYANVTQSGLCRVRLMDRFHTAGTDQQLITKWQRERKTHPSVSPQEDKIDKLCSVQLNPMGVMIEERSREDSARVCGSAQEVVKGFCSTMVPLCLPVNFLDFLSLLVLASLPSWPSTKTVMETAWLEPRRKTLAEVSGQPPLCGPQKAIIAANARQSLDAPSAARGTLSDGLIHVLEELRKGLSLEELSHCACHSTQVLGGTDREEVTRGSQWYWKIGSAILHKGKEDGVLITKARQAIVAAVLAEEVTEVSWWGVTTIKSRKDNREPSLFQVIWKCYLRELFGGSLRDFLLRIDNQTGQNEACRLAWVDTFFFVVTLDLVDVTSPSDHQADAAIVKTASHLGKLNKSVSLDVASGALALAVASGLAGAAGLSKKHATHILAASAGLATTAYAGVVAKNAYKNYRNSKVLRNLVTPSSHRVSSILTDSYTQMYDASFLHKREAVLDALLKLCTDALKRSKTPALAPANLFSSVDFRSIQLGKANKKEPLGLSPPMFFPLAPPGGGDPPIRCNSGIC